MSATLDIILEYDTSDASPFGGDIEGVIDFTKSFNIVQSKPYAFMQAIAGVRGDPSVVPKISPRGFPKKMHHAVEEYFGESYGLKYRCAGWLSYSEVKASLEHASLPIKDLDDSLQFMLEIFGLLSKKYGDAKARMIFAIGSP